MSTNIHQFLPLKVTRITFHHNLQSCTDIWIISGQFRTLKFFPASYYSTNASCLSDIRSFYCSILRSSTKPINRIPALQTKVTDCFSSMLLYRSVPGPPDTPRSACRYYNISSTQRDDANENFQILVLHYYCFWSFFASNFAQPT